VRAFNQTSEEESQPAFAWLRAGQHSGLEAELPRICSATEWTIPLSPGLSNVLDLEVASPTPWRPRVGYRERGVENGFWQFRPSHHRTRSATCASLPAEHGCSLEYRTGILRVRSG
jgi:hypothetical protein